MQLKDVGIQIATGELQANGKKVMIVIGKPEKSSEGDDYYCPYQIVGLGNECDTQVVRMRCKLWTLC
jgi:hypothetical protein